MVPLKEHGLFLMSEAMDTRASNSEDWDHSVICIIMASSFTFGSRCIWDDLKRFEVTFCAASCLLKTSHFPHHK